jgi:phosphate-selective porin OprO/OprP
MKITNLLRRLNVKVMTAGALIALSANPSARAEDTPAPPWATLPVAAPAAKPATKPAEEQPPAPIPLAPAPAPSALPADAAATKALMLDTIKQYEADKKKAEDEKKKADEEKKRVEGYIVGSDTKVSAAFENGWLWLRTPNNDFTMHIGAWVQGDAVFFDQLNTLKTAPGARSGPAQGVASGVAQGGIGTLNDGVFFRRIRPFIEGTFYEVFEYRLNPALENDQFQTSGLDEYWVGVNKIPLVGTVRVGHFKNAMGLEGDMSSSSRTMTFMERSSYSEAIELNQNFGTGILFGNAFLNDRVTYQATIVRPDNGASSGTFFGDDQWGWNFRLTSLPLFEDDGRQLLHLAASIGWRNGTTNNATSPDRVFQLRARPEMRDDDPAGSTTAGLAVPNANSNRMIDTGPIAATDDWILGLEGLYIRGPFSFQAEWGWNFLINAYGVSPGSPAPPLSLHPAIVPTQSYTFTGGYMQLAYTLTGENRAYDKRNGALARDYFKNGPYTNAWFTRDSDGGLNWGWGAWELAGRWTYTSLNDGVGPTAIRGGDMQGIGVMMNWYMNRDLKVQFNWNYDYRYNLPGGVAPGWVNSFGIETQLSF